MKASEYIKKFENDEYKDLLMDTYEDASLLAYQKERYIQALKKFIELFRTKMFIFLRQPAVPRLAATTLTTSMGEFWRLL